MVSGAPLQHLEVAVGVAEGGSWPLTDEFLDRGRLAFFIVEEVELGQTNDDRDAASDLVAQLAATA